MYKSNIYPVLSTTGLLSQRMFRLQTFGYLSQYATIPCPPYTYVCLPNGGILRSWHVILKTISQHWLWCCSSRLSTNDITVYDLCRCTMGKDRANTLALLMDQVKCPTIVRVDMAGLLLFAKGLQVRQL